MTSPSRSQIESSGSTSTSKAPSLSFSIENILGGKTLGKERRRADIPAGGPVTSLFKGAKDNSVPLPWLSYTRYCPPKIPRSRRRQKTLKRKSSGNPRVPFSTSQILKLEKEYSQNRYLLGKEVVKLSSQLNVAQHRIKIWFQNRRAREKRAIQDGKVVSFQNNVAQEQHVLGPCPCRPIRLYTF